MAQDELAVFREHWKQELKNKTDVQPVVSSPLLDIPGQKDLKNRYFEDKPGNASKSEEDCHTRDGEASLDGGREGARGGKIASEPEEDQPEYVSIARGLLGGRTSPLLDRLQEERIRRKRQYHSRTNICSVSLQQQQQQPQRKVKKGEELVDQLIQDLNEVNDIPFFDIELPYELALKIFQYLDCTELGRCAQVSKAWSVLAEDDVLWFKMCTKEGHHQNARVSDSPCWKSTLRDCRNSAKTVRFNWKNRVGSISQLQYELGKVLCDVSSCDHFVLAGYTSGDVRLWDTLHWDSRASYLKPNGLTANTDPRPHVDHVQVNGTVAAAAYEDGCVDVWSTETGEQPIHHYQTPERVQAFALSPDSPALCSSSGPEIRLDTADDRGYWRTACRIQLRKSVQSLVMVPGRGQQCPLVAAVAGDAVYLLSPREENPQTLHFVYDHPVTCLDASESQAAFGVRSASWAMYDGGNKIHVYSLETGKPVVCVGSSPGDFSCINLKNSPAHLLVCGNKDRRVRVYDLRSGSSVVSLYAHHLGVTSVQADDWKIVSGGGEGLVCVWEMRMTAKLWEMHNRHPVRHVRFSTSTLLTANIPDDKSPRGACITDDDLTAHRRHRGVICHYDFSEDALTQDHILPICRSNYAESSGYNYNISLTVPYDRLSASNHSH